MEKTFTEYWKQNYILGTRRAWEWAGVRGIILDIVISAIVGTMLAQNNIVLISLTTIVVAFTLYVLFSLFFAIFVVPFQESEYEEKARKKLQNEVEILKGADPRRQELANQIWLELSKFEGEFKPISKKQKRDRYDQYVVARKSFDNIFDKHTQSEWIFGLSSKIPKLIFELDQLLSSYGNALYWLDYYQDERSQYAKGGDITSENYWRVSGYIEESIYALWGKEDGLEHRMDSFIGQLKDSLYEERGKTD
jgi:hypothetical protein